MLEGVKRGQNNWSWTQKLEFRGVGGKMSGRAKQLEHGRRQGPVGQWDRAQQLGMELPQSDMQKQQMPPARLREASTNLREPKDGKHFFSFLTNSQKSLAKIELSNKEELKIG